MRQVIGIHKAGELTHPIKSWLKGGPHPQPVLWLKLGEKTGDVCLDSSPEGNDAERKGATWQTGFIDNGLLLDGLDDYILVPDSSTLRLDGAFTILLSWIRTGTALQILFNKQATAARNNYYCFYNAGNIDFRIYDEDGNMLQLVVAATTVNVLAHLAFVWTGTTILIYQDGALLDSSVEGTKTLDASAGYDLFLGTHSDGYAYPAKGSLDEPRIYAEAFTARQIFLASRGIF